MNSLKMMMMQIIQIPDYFKNFRLKMGGVNQEWIEQLPQLLSHYAEQWQLTNITPFPKLTYNYAASAIRADGVHVVIKASYPHDKESKTEIQALQVFSGHGIAQLLEVDVVNGIFLLEELEPGQSLTSVADDEEATIIAANVMKALWQPVPEKHNFPHITDWGKGFEKLRKQFDGRTGPLPEKLVDKAENYLQN